MRINGEPAEYGVVNEREIRGVAGLMMVIALATVMYSFLTKDLSIAQVVVPLFWLEFLVKVVFGPEKSLFLQLIRPLVSKLEPEYVGAIQKRFAWSIGLVLASIVFVLLFVVGMRGVVPLSLCGLCVVVMFAESALGICVGCMMYGKLIEWGWIELPEQHPACPGGVCKINFSQSKSD